MRTALLCREMKYTWEEYQNSPAPFIDNLIMMFNAEADQQKRANEGS
ncbi:MAG: hypothetical protein WC472_01625 [Candidatus Paceibacterota bacterium]